MKKKTTSWIYSLVIMGMFLILVGGCKKKDDNSSSAISDVDKFIGTYEYTQLFPAYLNVVKLNTTQIKLNFPAYSLSANVTGYSFTIPKQTVNNGGPYNVDISGSGTLSQDNKTLTLQTNVWTITATRI